MEEQENQLLEQIRMDIPESDRDAYYHLLELRKKEQLSPESHEKLKLLTNQMEIAHAKRMEAVVALANLRGVPLEQIMKELEIQKAD